MIDRNLLKEILISSTDVMKMKLLLDRNEKGVMPIGFIRQYQFVEPQDTLSLVFINSNYPAVLDSLFSSYLISDVNVIAFTPSFIVLDNDSIQRITKVSSGLLELVKMTEPLDRTIDRQDLAFQIEPVRSRELSSESLTMLARAWQSLSEAKVSNDYQKAASALQIISDVCAREIVKVSDRNPSLNAALSRVIHYIEAIIPAVKGKRLSISDIEQFIQNNFEK
jgi:hypothetical protein